MSVYIQIPNKDISLLHLIVSWPVSISSIRKRNKIPSIMAPFIKKLTALHKCHNSNYSPLFAGRRQTPVQLIGPKQKLNSNFQHDILTSKRQRILRASSVLISFLSPDLSNLPPDEPMCAGTLRHTHLCLFIIPCHLSFLLIPGSPLSFPKQ